MEKQLLSLTVVACCTVALSACSQATAPPTRPQASAESVVDIAEPADSGSDSGVSFAMPEPGPFVPGPDVDIFKPCEEIPDEVFAELGLRKDPEGGDSFAPFSCKAYSTDPTYRNGVIDFSTWEMSNQTMIDSGFIEEIQIAEQLNTGKPARDALTNFDDICEIQIETAQGTVSISYQEFASSNKQASLCTLPAEITNKLYK